MSKDSIAREEEGKEEGPLKWKEGDIYTAKVLEGEEEKGLYCQVGDGF